MSTRILVSRIVGGAALAALLAIPRTSAAETLLLLMDSGPPKTDQLKAVRTELSGQGLQSVIAGASLEDTALMLGCSPDEDECLDTVASTANADGLIVVPAGDGPLLARRAKSNTRLKVSRGGGTSALQAAVASLFGGSSTDSASGSGTATEATDTGTATVDGAPPPVDPDPTEVEPTEVAEALPATAVPASGAVEGSTGSSDFSLSKVQTRTWIVLGAGVAATGLGFGLLSVASSKQDEVDAHPVDSASDLDALRALENSGSNYTLGGNLFVFAGGVAVLTGVGLMLWDAKKEHREMQTAIIPTASSDGVGVAIRWMSK